MSFLKVRIIFIGMAIFALLSGAGFMATNATPSLVDNEIPIASLELVTIEPAIISGVPVPARKPKVKAPSVFQKLVNFTAPKGLVNNTVSSEYAPSSKAIDQDSFLYAEIFDLQKQGNMSQADEKINQLDFNILKGHILAERYLHPTGYKADYTELAAWMRDYADHPQAKRIHRLASIRKPKGSDALVSPETQSRIAGNLGAVSKRGKNYQVAMPRNDSQEKKVRTFKKDINRHLKRNEPTMALNILSTDYTVKFLDDVEYDRLRADIAAGYLFVNKLDQALKLSSDSYKRSGQKAPLAGWVKGLVQWQQRHYKSSAKAFESAASSPYSSGWMVSAAGYWASRAHMRAGNVSEVSKWLDLASTYPRTFYGLIATRALGHKTEFDWNVPKLTREHIQKIEMTPHGKRAAALIKVGEVDLAEAELRNINIQDSRGKREALIAYASHFKLPALSMQLGNAIKNKKGKLYDSALYPDTSWSPKSGYKIDRALIHAIVRQESRFRANAQNPSGATGLMQLMPATANYIAGKEIYHQTSGQHQLKDPSVNLELGQKYVNELLNHRSVGQDLLSLAIAYNAGPGNLSKWKSERAHITDPLLFIETIPYHETRAFVERVLSNYWIYRMRFDQDTPSLDAVAEGKWARYAAQDLYEKKLAVAN